MTCAEVRDMLHESLGADELSGEAAAHLAGCPACRALHEELRATAEGARTAGEFELTDLESARLLARIDGEIERLDEAQRGRTPAWLPWLAPAAAAAALILAIALTGDRFDPRVAVTSDSPATAGEATAAAEDSLYDDLDEPTVQALLEDVSARPAGEPSNALLDDLTDDEYEYLAKNFDIGDIL
ncbi:MAG TPA: hypothetical protein PK186_08730 [candidate division Zixibacteria bacterium]|nr:hypothetical protein [candidate division Zixibacteria bacterium]HPM37625.1 hypothetical protein [candidate division Zixibacteria bacterium]